MLTTTDAARMLGIKPSRVRQLAIAGLLRGRKAGRDWRFEERVIRNFERPPMGRPRKRAKAS